MPKKQHGRPQRSKPRPRRTPAAVPAGAVAEAETAEAVPQFATRPTATPVARPAARPSATAARRPASTARRAPVISINYAYLRRDLTTLAVLAPSMIVVLVVAFFVFH